MRNLLLVLLMALATNVYSQELKVYVPMRTYHYNRTPPIDYHKTEGGNIGGVAIYRKNHNKWYTDVQAGALRNSYGKLSFIGQYGVGRHIGNLDVSFNLGAISGYKILFEDITKTIDSEITYEGVTYKYTRTQTIENNTKAKAVLPKWMQDSGILPAVSLSMSYDVGRVSPLIVVSPEYINIGVVINIL